MKIQDQWWKLFDNWMEISWYIKGLQVKYSAYWNFCCKPSQAKQFERPIASQSQVNYLQRLCRALCPELRVYTPCRWLMAKQIKVRINSGPGLILGSWIMMRHVSCILLLEWSTTSQRLWAYRISVPYAQKDPRFLFEKRRGQPWEFWSLFSTIDGSTLPQDCVEEQLCWTRSNW